MCENERFRYGRMLEWMFSSPAHWESVSNVTINLHSNEAAYISVLKYNFIILPTRSSLQKFASYTGTKSDTEMV